MANSARRTIHYTPRYTDLEAFDLLPFPVREALREAITDWDAAYILRYYRKKVKESRESVEDFSLDDLEEEPKPVKQTVNRLRFWDKLEMSSPKAPTYAFFQNRPLYNSDIAERKRQNAPSQT